jgi:hypothetical protein
MSDSRVALAIPSAKTHNPAPEKRIPIECRYG